MRRRSCLLEIKTEAGVLCSAKLLVLWVVLCRVTGHSALRHTRVLRRRLLLLEVLLVVKGSLGGHVGGRHAAAGCHSSRLASGHLGVTVLGRVDWAVVDAVCVVRRRLRRVQAGLRRVSSCFEEEEARGLPG